MMVKSHQSKGANGPSSVALAMALFTLGAFSLPLKMFFMTVYPQSV